MINGLKEQEDYGDLNYIDFNLEPYKTMLEHQPDQLGKALIRMHFLFYNSIEVDEYNRIRFEEWDVIYYFQEYEKVNLYHSPELDKVLIMFFRIHEYLKNNYRRDELMPMF